MNTTHAAPDGGTRGEADDSTRGEDVVTLLTRQHRDMERQLDALASCDNATERAALLARAADELVVHIGAEEAVFYPAVRAARTEDVLLESLEEHLSLKRFVADLLAMPPDDATFQPKCKVLDEQAEHHHQEEEEHLFPKVNKLLDEAERRRLGAEVQAHQDRLRAPGAPRQAVSAQTDAAEPLKSAAPVAGS